MSTTLSDLYPLNDISKSSSLSNSSIQSTDVIDAKDKKERKEIDEFNLVSLLDNNGDRPRICWAGELSASCPTKKDLQKIKAKSFCQKRGIKRFFDNMVIQKNDYSEFVTYCKRLEQKANYRLSSSELIEGSLETIKKIQLVEYGEEVGTGACAIDHLPKGAFILYAGLIKKIKLDNDGCKNQYLFGVNIDFGSEDKERFIIDAEHYRNEAAFFNGAYDLEKLGEKFTFVPPGLISKIALPNFVMKLVWVTDLKIACIIFIANQDILVSKNAPPVPLLISYGDDYLNHLGDSLRFFSDNKLCAKSLHQYKQFSLNLTSKRHSGNSEMCGVWYVNYTWEEMEKEHLQSMKNPRHFKEISVSGRWGKGRFYLAKEELASIMSKKGARSVDLSTELLTVEDAKKVADYIADLLKEEFIKSATSSNKGFWNFTEYFINDKQVGDLEPAVVFTPLLEKSLFDNAMQKLRVKGIHEHMTVKVSKRNNSLIQDYQFTINSRSIFTVFKKIFLLKNKVDLKLEAESSLIHPAFDISKKSEMINVLNKFKNKDNALPSIEVALRRASAAGAKDEVEFLIKQTTNIDAQDNKPEHKRTALHWACFYKHWEIAKLLIKKGADINLKDASGKAAIDYIQIANNSDMLSFLKESNYENKTKIQVNTGTL